MLQHHVNGLWVEPVLDAVELREQGRRGLSRRHSDGLLKEDGAVVHALIHKVHRDPGDFHAPAQRLADRGGAGKGG